VWEPGLRIFPKSDDITEVRGLHEILQYDFNMDDTNHYYTDHLHSIKGLSSRGPTCGRQPWTAEKHNRHLTQQSIRAIIRLFDESRILYLVTNEDKYPSLGQV
jgi:hypothetical protein